MKSFNLLFLVAITPFLLSFSNEEQMELLDNDSTIVASTKTNETQKDFVDTSRYESIEMNFNDAYVIDLQQLVKSNFENQINLFKDKELGLIQRYKKTWKYIFTSKKGWEENQHTLNDKYFNKQLLEQGITELNQSYVNDIKRLRTQFYSLELNDKNAQEEMVKIPDTQITANNLQKYINYEYVFERPKGFVTFVVVVLIIALIIAIIGLPTGPFGWVAMVITYVLIYIFTIFYYHKLDKDVLKSLQGQEQKIQIDYDSIKSEMDNNTIHFYEIFK